MKWNPKAGPPAEPDTVDSVADLVASTLCSWVVSTGLLRDFLVWLDRNPQYTTFACKRHGEHSIFTKQLSEADLQAILRLFVTNAAGRYDPTLVADELTAAHAFGAM